MIVMNSVGNDIMLKVVEELNEETKFTITVGEDHLMNDCLIFTVTLGDLVSTFSRHKTILSINEKAAMKEHLLNEILYNFLLTVNLPKDCDKDKRDKLQDSVQLLLHNTMLCLANKCGKNESFESLERELSLLSGAKVKLYNDSGEVIQIESDIRIFGETVTLVSQVSKFAVMNKSAEELKTVLLENITATIREYRRTNKNRAKDFVQ